MLTSKGLDVVVKVQGNASTGFPWLSTPAERFHCP